MDINELMKKTQEMQSKLQDAQKKLDKLTVEGQSGGGLVKIQMKASNRDLTKTQIDDSLMGSENKTMLEDLICAAVNDANRKAEKASKQEISSLTSDMKMPFDLPGEGGEFDDEDDD